LLNPCLVGGLTCLVGVSQALVGTLVPVNTVEMFKTTLQMVVFPIVAGILLNTTFPKQVKMIAPFCPVVAVAAVSMICAAVVAQVKIGPSPHKKKNSLHPTWIVDIP
jgi:predicted Na+-dependent transporter